MWSGGRRLAWCENRATYTIHITHTNSSSSIPLDKLDPLQPKMPFVEKCHLSIIHTLYKQKVKYKIMDTCSIWLFPKPGSPTIRMCGSPRIGILFLSSAYFWLPPKSANVKPALTSSCGRREQKRKTSRWLARGIPAWLQYDLSVWRLFSLHSADGGQGLAPN